MTAGADDYAPDRKFQVQVFEEYDILTEAARISSLINHFKREIYYVAVFCNDGIKIMLCSGYRYNTCFALLAKTLMLQKGSCPKEIRHHVFRQSLIAKQGGKKVVRLIK